MKVNSLWNKDTRLNTGFERFLKNNLQGFLFAFILDICYYLCAIYIFNKHICSSFPAAVFLFQSFRLINVPSCVHHFIVEAARLPPSFFKSSYSCSIPFIIIAYPLYHQCSKKRHTDFIWLYSSTKKRHSIVYRVSLPS